LLLGAVPKVPVWPQADEELGAAVEGFDGVGTGEDEPVVGAEAGEGGVEGGE